MWDWGFGPGEAAWLLWAGWWLWQRVWRHPTAPPPVPDVPTAAPAEPIAFRKAQLLNTQGMLDSIRTISGSPPDTIRTAKTVYRRDETVTGTRHLVYRAEAGRG